MCDDFLNLITWCQKWRTESFNNSAWSLVTDCIQTCSIRTLRTRRLSPIDRLIAVWTIFRTYWSTLLTAHRSTHRCLGLFSPPSSWAKIDLCLTPAQRIVVELSNSSLQTLEIIVSWRTTSTLLRMWTTTTTGYQRNDLKLWRLFDELSLRPNGMYLPQPSTPKSPMKINNIRPNG